MDKKTVVSKNIEECKLAHQCTPYFDDAEPHMDIQWENKIWPLIKDFDFSNVLELAPGYGRNTERLLRYAQKIHLVDVNKICIDKCRERFANYKGNCKIYYHINDGKSIPDISSNSITTIYSWDSVVHFDKLVVKEYMKEFARLLAPGGKGFIHHSNYGVISQSSDWRSHPHNRSNMTRDLFREYAESNGLVITLQKLIDWEIKDLDCISLFEKQT